MSDEKLADECRRLGLPSSDQQIVNMKTLTEHLDSEIAQQKDKGKGRQDNSAMGSIKTFFGMDSQSKSNEQVFDKTAKEKAQKDLERIF